MKILFLTSQNPDYLRDVLFHGLINLIGRKKVIDFPRKILYHCNKKTIEERERGKCSCCLFNQSFRNHPQLHFFGSFSKLDDINVDDFDLILITTLQKEVINEVKKIFFLAKKSEIKIVFVDGEDDILLRQIYFYSNLYFKREILLNNFYSLTTELKRLNIFFHQLASSLKGNLHNGPLAFPIGISNFCGYYLKPLPMGIIDVGFKPLKEKEYDVSFIASLNSVKRLHIFQFLKKYVEKRKLKAFIGYGLPWSKYMEIFSKSKISISVSGGGFDTYRYWEIPYSGSMLLSEKPCILIPNNFEEGVSASFFKDLKELKEKLDFYLNNNESAEIAKNGRKLLMKYHTSVRRAKYLLDSLNF
jgi:hypothetical protein